MGEEAARWIWCGLVAVMGIVGLFVAAGSAHNVVSYWGGIGFFVFAVLFILLQIKLGFDERERRGHSH
ncbi:MAG: hypothetical protein IRY94_17130 [Rhodospirillaceae bacterium]|nr:hypothetical protein [Rhodospirillaceae bacterium]